MLLRPSKSVLVKRQVLNYLIAFESILVVCLTIIAVRVRHIGVDLAYRNNLRESLLLIAFPAIWLCCLALFGAWDVVILDNHIDGYRRLMRSSFMTFLTFSSTSYLFKIQISRFVILFSLLGGTILHLILRWVFLRIVENRLKNRETRERWLVISVDSGVALYVQEYANRQNAEVVLIKYPDAENDFNSWVKELVFQLTLGKYSRCLLSNSDRFEPFQIEKLMWVIQQTDAEFVVYNSLGLITSQSQTRYYDGFKWISIGTPQINDSLRVIKRVFDLVLVIPAIFILIPLYICICIAIKIDSRGKVIYTQTRIGQNGKTFLFPKFRSMHLGSDVNRLDVLGRPDQNMAERYKSDPRITRFGRLLRRFSLDELPQLWCVLIGTMSLVGPRPILPEEQTQLGEFHFRRQIAKPGLTGIWQVSGRKETSWEERMAFDIKYVQEWSLALDIILIAKTFKAIISGHGSY